MNLVQNVSDLDESVFQENIDVIRRTVGNFFIAYKSEGIEEQYRALDELLQSEVSANLIEEIVLKSVDKKYRCCNFKLCNQSCFGLWTEKSSNEIIKFMCRLSSSTQ